MLRYTAQDTVVIPSGINVAQEGDYLGFKIRKSVSSVAGTNYTNISKKNRLTSKGQSPYQPWSHLVFLWGKLISYRD